MNPDTPSWRPEPDPQNALERLMRKAAEDHSLDGQMFRLLWSSELSILIPDHPEMRGGFEVGNGSTITFITYADKDGPFIPVFTSEAAADYAVQKLSPKPWPAIATTQAEVIFRTLASGDTRVIVNPGLSARLVLAPEGVAALVAGEFTAKSPGEAQKMRVKPVPADKVPAKLRQGIRTFCAQRRVPIGVYIFHPFDEATGQWDESEFRIIVWLRHQNDHFYNDFHLLVGKLCPERYGCSIGVVTSDKDEASLAYLQTCTPLWPVMPAGK